MYCLPFEYLYTQLIGVLYGGHLSLSVVQLLASHCVLKTVCLQCFDTVVWPWGRASGLYKLSDEVLMWLSVWCKVQIDCIWSS